MSRDSSWTSGAKFVEFDPGRKARLRFADSEITSWEPEGSYGKTRLTMVHSGFDPVTRRS